MKRIRRTIENLASAVAYAEEGRREDALSLIDALSPIRKSSHAKVILASTEPSFAEPSLDYMRGLLERMPCDVLALTTDPPSGLGGKGRRKEAMETVRALDRLVRRRGAICLHQPVTGGLCDAIQKYCGLVRDVRFAVVQAREAGMAPCALPIPVFLVRA